MQIGIEISNTRKVIGFKSFRAVWVWEFLVAQAWTIVMNNELTKSIQRLPPKTPVNSYH